MKRKINYSDIIEKGSDYWEEIIISEYKTESDRGAVLISISFIDELLGAILEKKLVQVKSKKKERILNNLNPISSFSSKSNLCFRLGIISDKFLNILDNLRQIRNEFAHSFTSCNFDDKDITDKIDRIYKKFIFLHKFEKVNSERFGENTRGKFLWIINYITFKLISIINRTDTIQEKKIEQAFWNKELEDFFNSLPKRKDFSDIKKEYELIISKM